MMDFGLDIIEPLKKINIEYDGEFFHKNRKENDSNRDKMLISLGWKILRVSSNDVQKNKNITSSLKKCVEFLS